MLMKFLTLLMVLSIFTTQAMASTGNGLKEAFDELNYSLTVEWDQKNQNFYDEKVALFSNHVEALKSKGLTQSDMIIFAKSELKNSKSSLDLDAVLKLIHANKLTPSEANSYLLEALKGSYSQGASWNSDDDLLWSFFAIGLVVAAFCYGDELLD
jgi:hypothetical protein